MPYAPPALIGAAAEALKGSHPLAVLVIPAMVRAGVPEVTAATDGKPFGSGDELEVLTTFFKFGGGPPGAPYRAIWETKPADYWRDKRYPGRALQRIRTDRVKEGIAFTQAKAKPVDLWGLRPTVGKDLVDNQKVQPVRLVDLAIWYGRDRDVAGLDALVEWFLSEFPLDVADLIPTLYTRDVPVGYDATNHPFADAPAAQDEYAEAVGASPVHEAYGGAATDLASHLEACIATKGFVSSPRFVARVVGAWLRGDMVVLVGQPGTGKTLFSNLVADCLEAELGQLRVTKVPVRPDFDEGDLIGYEQLDGTPRLREFAETVLQSDDQLGTHLVVLDEFNLAAIETYMASILIAMEDDERRVVLPGGEAAYLPVDTFVLATCNSYLDEPETRLRVSYPTKRRAAVIEMPNVLYEAFAKDGQTAFVDHAVRQVRRETELVDLRVTSGRGTVTDGVRLQALKSVPDEAALSVKVKEVLAKVGMALVETPEGRSWFTLGLLKDVAITVALAPRSEDAELVALGEVLADKIVPQLRGPKERADRLLAAISDLPNRSLVEDGLSRMRSGPADELQQGV